MVYNKRSELGFNIALYTLSVLIILLVAYPLIFVLSASFSSPVDVMNGRVFLLPKNFSLDSYLMVFKNQKIWAGYKNTIIYTFLGTIINLVLTTLAAYPLSRRDMPFRNFFTFLITLTMMFGGGLIPTYLVVKSLGLTDNIFAMVIPGAISTYNLLVMRTYFQDSIPFEIQEAAGIDGCNDIKMLHRIILPLSKPILAVMVLFYAVAHWNSFFNALIYLRREALYPLQIVLREILLQNNLESLDGEGFGIFDKLMLGEAMKYSVIIISSLPVLILYPFIQKYFVAGIMIGAIKG